LINRIERAESSPTAVVLGKLAAAFQVSVSALLAPAEATGVHRMADATEWHDPATGYRRRQITGPGFPTDIAEVHLPPGARVPYPAASLAFQREAVWVLDGRLTFPRRRCGARTQPGRLDRSQRTRRVRLRQHQRCRVPLRDHPHPRRKAVTFHPTAPAQAWNNLEVFTGNGFGAQSGAN
jgi:transcriptional regulator with XRE-family HTH domain